MKTTYLSTFTPSMVSHETLEAILVQRGELVERVVDLIRESSGSGNKHHTLLIGPRGIGKTHIVSLVYHRIRKMKDIRKRLLIAWLREEEWGVSSLRDFLMRILLALANENNDSALKEKVETLYELDGESAERQAGQILKEYVANRTLLVLAENLDEIFNGLNEPGQQDLRSYIQENRFFTILATAQSLFNGVKLRESPFYGFFRIYHLEELTFEQATELLAKIAALKGDNDLASFVHSPKGRARIRAVHHLGGGNHRVYMIFSQFLDRDSLDSLVDAIMQTLEKLTPYYQSRMSCLSPQQRKIIEYLCERRGAATVKEIAQRCFATSQAVSSRLKDLRDKGYVRSETVGRESYYELREPLMRICLEVKKHQGRPIRLLIDFLLIWYSHEELQERLGALQSETSLDWQYLYTALEESSKETENPALAACWKDFKNYFQKKDFKHALEAAEDALSVRKDALGWAIHGLALGSTDQHEKALTSFDKAIELDPQESIIWLYHGTALSLLGKNEEAFLSWKKAIELDPDSIEPYGLLATHLMIVGKWVEGLQALNILLQKFSLSDHLSAPTVFEVVLTNLLLEPAKKQSWKERILQLVTVFEKHQCIGVLGFYLLRSISKLFGKDVTNKTAKEWLDIWKEVGGDKEEFELPLRLLEAAVRYKAKPDERILLSLPDEERRILKELLNIKDKQSPES